MKMNLKSSEIEALYANDLSAISRGQKAPPAEEIYSGIITDAIISGVPFDAEMLTFSGVGCVTEDGELGDDLLINVVTALAITNNVLIEVPYNFKVDWPALIENLQCVKVSLSVLPSGCCCEEDFINYRDSLLEIATVVMDKEAGIELYPYDQYIDYLVSAEVGCKPGAVSSDQYMNSIFTDILKDEGMNIVKDGIDMHLQKYTGSNGLQELMLDVASGIYNFVESSDAVSRKVLEQRASSIVSQYTFAELLQSKFNIDIYNYTAFIFGLASPFWELFHAQRLMLSVDEKEDLASRLARPISKIITSDGVDAKLHIYSILADIDIRMDLRDKFILHVSSMTSNFNEVAGILYCQWLHGIDGDIPDEYYFEEIREALRVAFDIRGFDTKKVPETIIATSSGA